MQQEDEGNRAVLADGRLKSPPSGKLLRYANGPSLEREKRHFHHFGKVDMAHAVMLVEQGILSRTDGASILNALRELDEQGPERFSTDPARGSFLLQVEDYLSARVGETVGGRIHTGRSRIDQGTTVRRLFRRDRLLDVIDRLTGLQATILGLATRQETTEN